MRYIWGEKLLYSHFHTICQGGGGGGGHFWGKIYYIVIFPPIQVRGENGFGGGGGGGNDYGGKWLYNTMCTTRFGNNARTLKMKHNYQFEKNME